MINNNKHDVKVEIYLISNGFKRKWLSDKSGYWLEYPFKGPFNLKGKLIVDTGLKHMYIDLDSPKKKGIMDGDFVTINYKYSVKGVKKILKEVKKVNNTKWMKK